MDKGKPVSFDLLRINKGMKKICRCNPPHYELSVENRIIMCSDCGAVVDPFEAMLSIAGYHEQLRKETKRLKEKVKVYSEEANKELKGCARAEYSARWKKRTETICFQNARNAEKTSTR